MKTVSKNLLIGTTSLSLAVVTLYGCSKFLTDAAKPNGTLNSTSLANQAGVEGSLIASYRPLDCTDATSSNWGCAASNWVWSSVAGDDSYKGSNGTDQPPINDIEAYHWSTSDANSYLNNKWQIVYEGVVRANSTLRLLASVQAASPGLISAADAKGIAGEAIFLRAYYHFEAYRMWGNVPYYRESDVDFRKPNEDNKAVVVDLLKDLDSAIVLLPPTPRNGQKGRATLWTAKAYAGRVLMYDGQFAAALAVLRDVQANGPYALETSYDHVWTGYSSLENGKETIFAYEASVNDGEPNGNNANFGERLNFPYSGSHFGCCGFNQPTQNLVNFYQVDAVGLPLYLSAPNTWNSSDANFTSAQNTTAVDPRLDWTVGRDGVPYKDWGPHNSATWVRDISNGGYYSPKKNAHEKGSGAESSVGWQNTQLNGVNIHLFRYADLLLLLAEAEVEAGSIANALTIVNQIRARAAVKVQGPGTTAANMAVPINDPSVTWATYRVGPYPAFPSQAYARQAVRDERRLELALEGQRLFDLRRWGVYDVVLNGFLTGVGGGKEASVTRRAYLIAAEPLIAKHRWYPLPSVQIDLSKVGSTPMLKQNTGW